MRRCAVLICLLALSAMSTSADIGSFDKWFTGQTLRLDLFHTGTADFEYLSLDRARVEGPWPGSRTQLLDTTNLGKYRFEVVDVESNRVERRSER